MKDDKIILDYLTHQIDIITELKKNNDKIKEIFFRLFNAKKKGNTIYIIGNGGSASTASHFTSDLLKTSITKGSKRFRAISLTDNIPVILAWANDESYQDIFLEQLKNFLKKDDIVIGISGSGNSVNVINAIKYANKIKAITISLTGKNGGKLAKISKTNLTIPSNDMLTIETMHLCICHLLTTMIRSKGKPLFSY